ncbi:hypothetical protein Q8W40_05725 [Vibrio penaeicida]|uniref:hypothetical protein n=1 Tax=Vibrio penaeicida TaxID=104609 RepID=UPI00273372CE|nr:hypothetical protein [Vibrio penaeicida]MDP2571670.1 hypothetical protein [Vibrio penaeicida]
MSAVQYYTPDTASTHHLSTSRLMQLTRPTGKTRFVKRGDEVHLLVFLDDGQELPFLRVSVDSLMKAAAHYEAS